MGDKIIGLLKKPSFLWGSFSVFCSILAGLFAGSSIVLSCFKSALSIILAICIGSAAMMLMERYSLFDAISVPLKPLLGFARLPRIAGAAFSIAFFSRSASNALLADERRKENVTRREMIFGAMGSAYPSMAFNYFQIMFPVIGAIGIAGLAYFAIVNVVGVLTTIVIFLSARCMLPAMSHPRDIPGEEYGASRPVSWRGAWENFKARTLMLVSRIIFITVPLFILTALVAEKGFFELAQGYFPDKVKELFSPEIITVAFARMGSIFGAAGIGAELLRQNQIDARGLVIAFLLGNLLSMPFRFIRKTLPASVGIFSGTDGFIIAIIPQALRVIFIIIAIFIVCLF
jgi:hypothetical protein